MNKNEFDVRMNARPNESIAREIREIPRANASFRTCLQLKTFPQYGEGIMKSWPTRCEIRLFIERVIDFRFDR